MRKILFDSFGTIVEVIDDEILYGLKNVRFFRIYLYPIDNISFLCTIEQLMCHVLI